MGHFLGVSPPIYNTEIKGTEIMTKQEYKYSIRNSFAIKDLEFFNDSLLRYMVGFTAFSFLCLPAYASTTESPILPHFYKPPVNISGERGDDLLGLRMSPAGDLNGDGFKDFVISTTSTTARDDYINVVYGGEENITVEKLTFQQPFIEFGSSLSFGDFNGDGFDDLFVMARSYISGEYEGGALFLYSGGRAGITKTPTVIIKPEQNVGNFANSIAAKGDLNSDGYDDLVVGSPNAENNENNEGLVYIYYGSPDMSINSPDQVLEANIEQAGFGSVVRTSGDIDGDGFDDLLVGKGINTTPELSSNVVWVYYGSSDGLNSTSDDTISPDNLRGDFTDYRFGAGLNHVGDINNDSFDDIIIGNKYLGTVSVYYGNPERIFSTSDTTLLSPRENSDFGGATASSIDVNSDGINDVIIGAQNYDGDFPQSGAVFVYLGSQTGPSNSDPLLIEPEVPEERGNFGSNLASVGDLNSDGVDDFAISAPFSDGDAAESGVVSIYISNIDDSDNDGIPDYLDNNPMTPNTAPRLVGQPPQSIEEDQAYKFIPSVVDDGDTTSISFEVKNLPNWLSFDETNGEIAGIPENNHVGQFSNIEISVSDGYLSSTLEAFDIEVLNINDQPSYLGTLRNVTLKINGSISLDISSSFNDVDASDSLSFSASGLPVGISISQEGVISGSSNTDGDYSVVVTATDIEGLSVDGSFSLTVGSSADTSQSSESGGGSLNIFFYSLLLVALSRKLRNLKLNIRNAGDNGF